MVIELRRVAEVGVDHRANRRFAVCINSKAGKESMSKICETVKSHYYEVEPSVASGDVKKHGLVVEGNYVPGKRMNTVFLPAALSLSVSLFACVVLPHRSTPSNKMNAPRVAAI